MIQHAMEDQFCVECPKKTFELLESLLKEDYDLHGFEIINDDDFYMYAPDEGNENFLSKKFLIEFGKLIESNDLPFIEFSYACVVQNETPSSDTCYGGEYRINTKGEIIYPAKKNLWD